MVIQKQPPTPRKRKYIKPFMDCWNNIQSKDPGNNWKNYKLDEMGFLGMKVVDPNGWEEELANKCALVRGD